MRKNDTFTDAKNTNGAKHAQNAQNAKHFKHAFSAKYFVIALLLAVIAITAVGVSKWNVHVQQIYANNFNYVTASATLTNNEILDRYVKINGTAITENDATAGETAISAYYLDTAKAENATALIYSGKPFDVSVSDDSYKTLTDEKLNGFGWEETFGIGFTYAYKRVQRFNASGQSVACDELLESTSKPTNAGVYKCVITAVANGDKAQTAVDKLNVFTNPFDTSKKCATVIEFTITRRAITVSVYDKTSVYGDEIVELTATTTDSVAITDDKTQNGGTLSTDLNKIVKLYTTKTESGTTKEYELTKQSPVGEYGILGENVNENYAVTFNYPGATSPEVQSIAFLFNSDDVALQDGETNAPENGTYTITTRFIEVTIDDQTSVYGDALTSLTCRLTSGSLVNGDELGNVIRLSTTATSTSDVGAYPITGTVYDESGMIMNANYAVTFKGSAQNGTDGKYTITKRTLTLNFGETEFTYNGSEQKPTATVSNLCGDDTCTVTVSAQSGSALTGEKSINAGAYTLTVKLPSDNYIWSDDSTADKTLNFTINPKPVVITWRNLSLEYNGKAQKPTATVSNLCDGDTCTVTVSGEQTNAGNYTATATALGNANYTLTGGSNLTTTFTITKRLLTLNFSGTAFTYNGSEQKPTATVSNLCGDDTCTATVSAQSGSALTSDKSINAGAYTLTVVLPSDNYTWSGNSTDPKTCQFTINKLAITVKANDQSATYTGAEPTVEDNYVITLTNGETLPSFVTGELSVTVTKQAGVNAGDYTLTPNVSAKAGYSLNNYDVTTTVGTFTITKATVDVPSPATQTFTYNGTDQTYNIAENANYTITGNKQKNAGSYTATVSLNDKANYRWNNSSSDDDTADKTYNFTITKASLTIKADDKQISQGKADGLTFTCTTSGTIFDGDEITVTYTVKDASDNIVTDINALPEGKYTITPVAEAHINYDVKCENGTLTIIDVKLVTAPTPAFTTETYNGTDYNLFMGDVDFDNITVTLNGTAVTDNTALKARNAGKYTVIVSLKDATNCKWSDGTTDAKTYNFTINKRPITVTIENKTSVYGAEIVELTATTTDQVANKDGLTNIISLSTTATSTSSVDTYSITGTANGTKAQNYDVTFVGNAQSGKAGLYEITNATITNATVNAYSGTYDGTVHNVATVNATTVNGQKFTVEYKLTTSSSYTTTVPKITNAGSVSFSVRISAPNHDTLTLDGPYTATVSKANPIITYEKPNLGDVYIESNVITITVQTKNISQSVADLGTLTLKNTTKNTIKKTGSGTYTLSIYVLYNNGEANNANVNVDYLLTGILCFNSTNYNYTDAEISYDCGKVAVKPVAYNKNTTKYYGTVHNAVNSATSGQSIYVIPGNNISITENLIITNSISFYIPYEGENWDITADNQITANSQIDTNSTNVNKYRKSQLIFTNGADLIINSGSTVYLGAIVGIRGIYSNYTEITLDTDSCIEVSGNFYCYGYVKEKTPVTSNASNGCYNNEDDSNRYLKINSTGYLKTVIAIYDMSSGGVIYTLNNNNICPFNTFDFPSIQTYMTFESGSKFDGQVRGTAGSGNYINTPANLIRQSTSEDALFHLQSGNISIEYLPKNNSSYTNTAASSNIYINGNVKLGYIKFTQPTTINTANYFLPISYKLQIYALNNCSFSIPYKLKLLPGSLFQINEGATTTISSKLAIHTSTMYYEIPKTNYATGKQDANFVNNGTVIISSSGAVGGKILTTQSTKDAAVCNFANATSTSAFSVSTNEGTENVTVTYKAIGDFFDESTNETVTAEFVQGSTIKSYGFNDCWYGSMNTTKLITVNISDPDGVDGVRVCAYNVYQADDANGTNQTKITATDLDKSATFNIPVGKYFKITENNYISASFSESPDGNVVFTNNTWYKVTGNYTIEITANVGHTLTIGTESESGAGTTKYTLYTSTSQNGTYTEVDTYTTNFSLNLLNNTWFYIEFKGGTNSSFNSVEVDYTEKRKGPADMAAKDGFKFGSSNKYQLTCDYNIFVYIKEGSCVAAGTLITLADGSQKKVEDLLPTDILLVFDHETGTYKFAPLLVNEHVGEAWKNYRVVNLNFSNGSTVKVIYEHGFFDVTLNKYVYIRENNYKDYIGHKFYSATWDGKKYSGKAVTLESVIVKEEFTAIFNPMTSYGYNLFTENILSVTTGLMDSLNTFVYDENMKYDEALKQADIEKYGLFRYEDFKDYMSEDIFEKVVFKYYKVAIAKGLITMDYIEEIMLKYVPMVNNYHSNTQRSGTGSENEGACAGENNLPAPTPAAAATPPPGPVTPAPSSEDDKEN